VSSDRSGLAGKKTRDERGDPSVKALKVTIAVCLVGLIGVYLFAFAPKPVNQATAAPRPTSAGTVTKAKEPVAKFDRESLSTKNR
jgi:hypothetical protein